ncbi:ATP-dependent RecD-like DNA helicase [Caldalkalibacillus thermarum]|nr:ATP-dependent RecD-like DNA helicase [Caldalkalibacillus thermarum]
MLGVDKGEDVEVHGNWSVHPKYGRQFEIERWERPLPATEEQAIAFLSSGLVKGCGPKLAKTIVKHLGSSAVEIMMEQGESAIRHIKGIGEKNARTIIQSVKANFEVQKIIGELGQYGISTNMAMKIYKEYGSNAVSVVKENPYLLTKLDLVGFLKADEIARKVGVSPLSGYRIEACTDYVLKEKCMSLGHCYLPESELINETLKVLNHNQPEQMRVTREDVEKAIYNLELRGRLIFEGDAVYPKYLHTYEKDVACKLSKLTGCRDGEAMPKRLDAWIRNYQRRHGIVLAEQQREAIRQLFANNVLILTGGPGTGKTTVTKALIDIYRQKNPNAFIGLCAPTGRAARRLAEVTGMEASTIHSMIGFRPGEEPEYNRHNPLPFDFIIVDEVSMMDIQLAYYLLEAIDPGTKVLFVGDVDQLPSVNPGNFLKDMIEAGIPTVKLTEIFRQAQESQIVVNAHRVNKGQPVVVDESKNDFYFLYKEDPKEIAQLIKKSVLRFLQLGYGIEDILVLSPMKKGPIGTHELNLILQEAVNPPSPAKDEWKVGKTTFRQGDKVIHTKNNREKGLNNGEMGIVTRTGIWFDENGVGHEVLYCNFMGREVRYLKDELKELQLAYAITIHKSQGGQAPVVIMPVSTSHYIMLARNLIYTGMTRAEQKVVMIGTKKALNIAIRNNKIAQRNTKLKERLLYTDDKFKPVELTMQAGDRN